MLPGKLPSKCEKCWVRTGTGKSKGKEKSFVVNEMKCLGNRTKSTFSSKLQILYRNLNWCAYLLMLHIVFGVGTAPL